jgi:hypothetical protein
LVLLEQLTNGGLEWFHCTLLSRVLQEFGNLSMADFESVSVGRRRSSLDVRCSRIAVAAAAASPRRM